MNIISEVSVFLTGDISDCDGRPIDNHNYYRMIYLLIYF